MIVIIVLGVLKGVYSYIAQYPYILGLYIMAVISIFVVTTIYVSPPAIAQNMTDGNMTGGNMTDGNMTGQISNSREEVEARCSLSPACIT